MYTFAQVLMCLILKISRSYRPSDRKGPGLSPSGMLGIQCFLHESLFNDIPCGTELGNLGQTRFALALGRANVPLFGQPSEL